METLGDVELLAVETFVLLGQGRGSAPRSRGGRPRVRAREMRKKTRLAMSRRSSISSGRQSRGSRSVTETSAVQRPCEDEREGYQCAYLLTPKCFRVHTTVALGVSG